MRRLLVVTSLLALAACADEGIDVAYNKAPRADLKLKGIDAELAHTSSKDWTLSKVGSLGAQTITWQVTATPGATQSHVLTVNGLFKVRNNGNAGATIGNIVVNLQTRHNDKWVTRSSVVADATQDDDATTANVSPKGNSEKKSSFSENVASRSLVFTDANTNSTFALVPQVTIPPNGEKKLRFAASFDNAVLQLPVGAKVRAEVIVSFGNAKSDSNSSQNIDINGNGIIDHDEKWVRSISDTEIERVPAKVVKHQTPTLIDEVSDITTTGTVTFSNPQIVINGNSAIVTVNYNGGTKGGTITNCAHLRSDGHKQTVGGTNNNHHDDDSDSDSDEHADPDDDEFQCVAPIDLTTCSTLTIGPHTCPPGTAGCGWEQGDVITYVQDEWGVPSTNAGMTLANHYDTVYAATFGIVEVGIPGPTGFSMEFSSAGAIFNYQPASGPPAALDADLSDPTSSASGIFGGEVLALRLNIDFSDAGHTAGSSMLRFGDLRLCGITSGPNNVTVREFSAIANTALGGGSTPYTIDDLNTLTQNLNFAFNAGAPSTFAQQHLFVGACPP